MYTDNRSMITVLPAPRHSTLVSSFSLPAHLLPHEPGGHLPEFLLQVFSVDTPEQVEKDSDQTGPPRLVAGAETRSVVTVEGFMGEDQIAAGGGGPGLGGRPVTTA